jgi:hypothetical protein
LRPLGYLFFGSAILIAVGGIIYAKVNLHKYDNSHLLKILQEYHETRIFPKSIKRNPVFYKTLKVIRKDRQ